MHGVLPDRHRRVGRLADGADGRLCPVEMIPPQSPRLISPEEGVEQAGDRPRGTLLKPLWLLHIHIHVHGGIEVG